MAESNPRSVLLSLRKRTTDMKNERERLLRQITDLDATLAEVDAQCDLITNELIPISSLPNEILGEIFVAGSNSCGLQRNTFNISICQVSAHFRSVALNTPGLWKTLHLTILNPWHTEMAAAYLLRSGTLPVDLRIHMTGTMRPNVLVSIHSTIQVLKPHIKRWRKLYIHCTWHFGVLEFLDRLKRLGAPLLERIDVHARLRSPGLTDSVGNIFAGGTPSLKHVRLLGIPLQCCLPDLATVTNLRIHSGWVHTPFNYDDFYRMLSTLPLLTHLVVDSQLEPRIAGDPIYELSSLRSLVLRGAHCWSVLCAVSAPCLQSLVVDSVQYEHLTPYLTSLESGNSSRFPMLRSLTLCQCENPGFTSSKWTSVMRAFPAIEEFTFSYLAVEDFLEAVRAGCFSSSNGSVWWPELHTLTLSNHLSPTTIRPNMLRVTIESRTLDKHPIKKLRLSNSIISALGEEAEWLREHVELEACEVYPTPASDRLVDWSYGEKWTDH